LAIPRKTRDTKDYVLAAQAMRREAAAMRERSRAQRRHAAAQRQRHELPLGVTLWCEDCKRDSRHRASRTTTRPC
jgi:hypothetical protein